MPLSSYPAALKSIFQTAKPNGPIEIFEGDFTIHAKDTILPYYGKVEWDWLPSPKLVVKAEFQSEKEGAILSAVHEAFYSHNMEVHIPRMAPINILPTKLGLGGNIEGHLHGMYIPNEAEDIKEIIFHIPNFIDYHGQLIKDTNSARSGRLLLLTDKWVVTIDNLSNTDDLFKSLEDQGGFAITHIGSVKRIDAATFTFEEVEAFMHCLSFFLSFVSGRWSPPILWMAQSYDGKKPIMMTMANPQVASWRAIDSWFNSSGQNSAQDISKLLPLFFKRFNEARRLLQLSVSWYLEVVAKQLVSDSRIVLTQVALELLAESLPPLLGHKLPGKAEGHLRGLLSLLVPTAPLDVPSSLPFLKSILTEPLARSWNKSRSGLADGPSVVVSIRNKITHAPRTPAEKALLSNTMVMFEASQLSIWYLELVLLGWFGYAGRYRSRLQRTGWVGEGEIFPPL